jgi:hypothetical protein
MNQKEIDKWLNRNIDLIISYCEELPDEVNEQEGRIKNGYFNQFINEDKKGRC